MTRRYAPTVVAVTHSATEVADLRRARARPVPVPTEPERKAPAAWEAEPEPTPAPQPRAGRPLKIVVERPFTPLAPGQTPDDATVNAVLDSVFGNRAPEGSPTRQEAAASLRRTQQRKTTRRNR